MRAAGEQTGPGTSAGANAGPQGAADGQELEAASKGTQDSPPWPGRGGGGQALPSCLPPQGLGSPPPG